jgi:hypothetical protein
MVSFADFSIKKDLEESCVVCYESTLTRMGCCEAPMCATCFTAWNIKGHNSTCAHCRFPLFETPQKESRVSPEDIRLAIEMHTRLFQLIINRNPVHVRNVRPGQGLDATSQLYDMRVGRRQVSSETGEFSSNSSMSNKNDVDAPDLMDIDDMPELEYPNDWDLPINVFRRIYQNSHDHSFDERDVELVVYQAHVSRTAAIAALRECDGNIITAIMDLMGIQ